MKDVIVVNFERTLEMLARAIDDCPDDAWDRPDEAISIWQYAYHCLLGLDVWVRQAGDAFTPAPFHNAAGGRLLKGQGAVMTREQIAGYRDAVYARCRAVLESTSADDFAKEVDLRGFKVSLANLVLEQMRHIQHHVGSMHTQLRRHTGAAPQWVGLG
jgi:uncharacterized damage-inducible protein DinB